MDGVAISLVLGSALWVQAQPPPKETAEAQVVDVEPEIPVPRMENDKLRWVGSFDKARAEAALRNVPILVVLGEDKNTGLSSMLGKVFFQQSFANAARDSIVPLIAMKGLDHDGDEQLVGGEPVKICKFFSVPCKEHDESFERLWSGMVFRSYWGPIMIFLRPDGSEILRIEGSEHGQERILEEIGYAVKQVGEGLGESAYCKQIDRVVRARKLLSSGQVQKALKELSRLESAGTEGFLEFERREREKIDAEGQAALAAILENAAAEHRNRTLNELRTLIRAYAGLPVEKQAQAALDQRDQD